MTTQQRSHNVKPTKRGLLPAGIDNFRKLITHHNTAGSGYLFVDKTAFIKAFIESGDEITLITRPRRFGKTLTLSMLEHFLAQEVDGKPTQGLFDGLAISRYPEVMRHQGQHPVIFLTFKEVQGLNFAQFFARFKESIRELFAEHRYLLAWLTEEDDKALFQRLLNRRGTRTDYEVSLKFLSTLLHRYTGKQVTILLDEYDTPIHEAFVNGYYKECTTLLAAMFGKTFKGNSALGKALITGILKVGKASLFSALNNIYVYTMLDDPRYPHYFGFTEAETNDLLDRAGLPPKAHELKEMYNGYALEDYTLYNPFSIISFAHMLSLKGADRMSEALKPYWVNTGGTRLLTDIMRHNVTDLTPGLQSLLQDIPLQTPINEDVTFDPQLRHNNVGFWSLLLLAGYLKVVEKKVDSYGFATYALLFPNQEIARAMRLAMMEIITGGLDYKDTYNLGMQALVAGKVEAFADFLAHYMERSPSYFDTGGPIKELFYHGLVLGMASALSHSHHITSNRESGGGRYDIALMPKSKQDKGVLLEIKVAAADEDLKSVAQKALAQITDKKYAAHMRAQGIRDIVCVGIAFRAKTVAVAG